MELRSSTVATGRPPASTITSPRRRPASAAGEPLDRGDDHSTLGVAGGDGRDRGPEVGVLGVTGVEQFADHLADQR
jgi:hypothetical protein